MKRAVILVLMVVLAGLLVTFLGFGSGFPNQASSPDGGLTTSEVVQKNIEAGGGLAALQAIRSLSFACGGRTYTVSADGRMKVQAAFALPAVFETLLVEPSGVRRNSLGRIEEIRGMERHRWRTLARLASGVFTLRNFAGPWDSAGLKTYGPRRYYVLSTSDEGTGLTANIDAGDFLVKRLVLRGSEGGEEWELSIELGDPQATAGLAVPSMIFISQPGISQTSAPGPRPVTEVKFNEPLSEDFFRTLDVYTGTTESRPGWLKGQVMGALFEPEDFFVLIVTNWTEKEVQAAGLRSGEMMILRSGEGEFASRFLFIEDDAEPEFKIYDPGNSFLTHNASRFPMFYVQFNRLEPPERFEALRSQVRLLAPIEADGRNSREGNPQCPKIRRRRT